MRVVATAGHVDHGKSRLVRALTGMEPDRWAEERRRGMTIDLGFAWTRLGEETVAFVDVPGHERFLGNMLAGIGPAPAVLFVVAADQGWQAQSAEHVRAVRALGIEHLLLVVTRADLADPAPTTARALAELAAVGLPDVASVAVSAHTGAGLGDVRAALSVLVASVPTPRTDGRVRLWVDRAFTISGAGTVVTGTLAEGTIGAGDELRLRGRTVTVRGLQSLNEPVDAAIAPARVALNLRGVRREEVARGDVLLTPDAWPLTDVLDVLVDGDADGERMLHAGTAAVPVRVRPLGAGRARLRWAHRLPLVVHDRVVLREPGSRTIVGARVLDADPPPLRRRGAAAARAVELQATPDATHEVTRRGAITRQRLRALGFDPDAADAEQVDGWVVAHRQWSRWTAALAEVVDAHDPLDAGLTQRAATDAVGLPDPALLPALAAAAGVRLADGRLTGVRRTRTLGHAEPAVAALERTLAADPFAAPERPELERRGLGRREIAAAVRQGRLLELPGGVVLRPDVPTEARALLSSLPQPFTLSQARQAMATTRRVAVPLLEHLDALGVTERVDGQLRRVRADVSPGGR